MSVKGKLASLERQVRNLPKLDRAPYLRIAYDRGSPEVVIAEKKAAALRQHGLSPSAPVNWIERIIVRAAA